MEVALAKILVVDDDIHIANLIARFLKQKQYQVECTHDGQNAIDIFRRFCPDLVILDINVEDKKRGFSTGADDYLTKPFDLEELEFRVQAILRRRRVVDSAQISAIEIGDLSINPETRWAFSPQA